MPAQEKSIQNESRHAVFVNRYAGGLSREFLPYLEQLKKEINHQLMTVDETMTASRKLRRVVKAIADIQEGIYSEYNDSLFEQLELFSEHEVGFELDSLNDVILSSAVELEAPATSQVWAAARTNPLIFPDSNDVVLLNPFIKNWSANEVKRVSNIISTGFITGETNQQIARKITGKGGYLDKKTRANNKAIVRTATNHVSAIARDKTMSENSDIVIGYEWVSTLDSRTSQECKSLDGKVFKWKDSGYKPKPPIHPNCRSTTAPVVDQRYSIDDGTAKRASKGVEGGQPVKADHTYYSWLKTQPAAFQNETLGVTQGKLFRNGGLTSDEFAKLTVDQKFRPLTLDEMRAKNPLAFNKAGV